MCTLELCGKWCVFLMCVHSAVCVCGAFCACVTLLHCRICVWYCVPVYLLLGVALYSDCCWVGCSIGTVVGMCPNVTVVGQVIYSDCCCVGAP